MPGVPGGWPPAEATVLNHCWWADSGLLCAQRYEADPLSLRCEVTPYLGRDHATSI